MDTEVPDRTSADDKSGAETRFRILKRGNWRRALKLETIFWTILEKAARENATKLTDYVQSLLQEHEAQGNQTSRLRAQAAHWLHERLLDHERRLRESGPARFLKAVPLPGFIISADRGLIAYNGDFMQFVHQVAAQERIPRVSDARLNLDAPIGRIVQTLGDSSRPALDCGFQLALNDRRTRGRVRVSLVPGTGDQPDVMGFVIAVEGGRPAGRS